MTENQGEQTTTMVVGPITGSVTISDGTTYEVSDDQIVVPLEHSDEVMHLIGLRYAAEGHPNVEGPFPYDVPERFSDYEPHEDNTTLTTPTQE